MDYLCHRRPPVLGVSLVFTLIVLVQLYSQCRAASPDVSDPCASAATQRHSGDIAYFPSAEDLANNMTSQRVKRAATSRRYLLWPGGIVYYAFSSTFSEEEEMKVIEGMHHWEARTCIRFQKRTNQVTYVNFFKGSGCCSYVGHLGYGKQGISLSQACLKFPTIVHEIGHAIGFWHEHTRPDRDSYIDVLYDNIEDGYINNFKKIHPSNINSQGIGYDYNSIMHYNRDFFARTNGQDTIRAKDSDIPLGLAVELSQYDAEQTNRLYSDQCGRVDRPSSLPDPIPPTPPSLPFWCGAILSTYGGSFVSLQHPSSYPPNTDCAWLVHPPGSFLLTVEIVDVAIEQSEGCKKDYIKVYEGSDEKGILRAIICGTHEKYSPILIGSGSVFIRFHSDGTNESTGFRVILEISDLDECVRRDRCSHHCRNTYGAYECYCRYGFYLSADGHTCFDINECGVNNGGCKDVCVNTAGSYHCACTQGHLLEPDKVSCRPPGASCSIHNGGCHHNCTETLTTKECSCVQGYRLEPDGRTCFDINECNTHSHGCQHKCINTLGSYYCTCNHGYHLNPDNGSCSPDRVCEVNNGGCNQKCQSGGDGAARCYCKNRGYRLGKDETTCEDIDECVENRRICTQICNNTIGSYYCDCFEGYELSSDRRNCRNINECERGIDDCEFSQYCRDNYGSYTCGCPSGYNPDYRTHRCIDINECEIGYQHVCSHSCRNIPGTFECTCPPGFVLNGQWDCFDVDECSTFHSCDSYTGARCQNNVGSYVCVCPKGLRLDESGWRCIDIDECSEGTYHCANGKQCVNKKGNYICEQAPSTTPPTISSAIPNPTSTLAERTAPLSITSPELEMTIISTTVREKPTWPPTKPPTGPVTGEETPTPTGSVTREATPTGFVYVTEPNLTPTRPVTGEETPTPTGSVTREATPTGLVYVTEPNLTPTGPVTGEVTPTPTGSVTREATPTGLVYVTEHNLTPTGPVTGEETPTPTGSVTREATPTGLVYVTEPNLTPTGPVTGEETPTPTGSVTREATPIGLVYVTEPNLTPTGSVTGEETPTPTGSITREELSPNSSIPTTIDTVLTHTTIMDPATEASPRTNSGVITEPVTELEPDAVSDPCDEAGCEYSCRIVGDEAAKCFCKSGYSLEGDGRSCTDINECSVHRCSQVCLNTLGSFECVCYRGFRLELDNTTCSDIDECGENNGGCSHTCINKPPGSFTCLCPSLHYLSSDGYTCLHNETTIRSPPTTTTSIDPSYTTHATHPTTQQDPATEQLTLPPLTEYQCGGLLTNENGSIHSQNWPETYPTNMDCEWIISLPDNNQIVEISFDDSPFGIAGNMPRCRKDWIKVYSLGLNQTVMAEYGPFCGFPVPSSIVTKTNVAKVQFYSGPKHGSARKGFQLYYSALDQCTPQPPPLSVEGNFGCNKIIRPIQKFGPPEFPGFISAETSESCSWILVGRYKVAQLRFLYFDLPESKDCKDNNVKLYRSFLTLEKYLIKTFCGHLKSNDRIVEIDTYFTLKLTLGSRNGTFRGFHAILEYK